MILNHSDQRPFGEHKCITVNSATASISVGKVIYLWCLSSIKNHKYIFLAL